MSVHGHVRASLIALMAAAAVLLPASAQAGPSYPSSKWYGPLPGLSGRLGRPVGAGVRHRRRAARDALRGPGGRRGVPLRTGGATWSAFNDGFPNVKLTNVRALLASGPTTIYAGTDSGIRRSTGGPWSPMAQGDEDDPAHPKRLNQSVQSLLAPTGGSTLLAGVFSGGVYKSTDGGATWSPPPANSGMPASETVYGLTENVPGLVYATAGSGVYVSTDQGSTWSRRSDGIPGSASPITTWAFPEHKNILFTSTASNGIYRSVNAGLTWAPINDGLGAVRARGLQVFTASGGAHVYAATENGLWEALPTYKQVGFGFDAPAPEWRQVTKGGLAADGLSNEIMWSLTAPTIPSQGSPGLIAGTQSDGGFFLGF